MCVIITLPRNTQFNYEFLKTATLNNPHGFGIVAVNDGKLEVYHRLNEKGNDPDEVAAQLDRWKDAKIRHLHLRYKTRGDASRDNTHPFTVYKTGTRRIEFMHNGSINRYQTTPYDSVASDTRQYAVNFLAPFLERFTGDNGIADISDPFMFKMLSDHFSLSCRGLLIANDLAPLYLGGWTKFKSDDTEFIVSNDDYFKSTISHRMTDHYKPTTALAVQSQAKAGYYDTDYYRSNHNQNPTSASSSASPNSAVKDSESNPLGSATLVSAPKAPVSTIEHVGEKMNDNTSKPSPSPTDSNVSTMSAPVTSKVVGKEVIPLKNVDLAKAGRFLTPDDLGDILDITTDVTDFDSELLGCLAFISDTELSAYVENNAIGATKLLSNLIWVSNNQSELIEDLEDDKDKATKLISSLKKQIADLQKEVVVMEANVA